MFDVRFSMSVTWFLISIFVTWFLHLPNIEQQKSNIEKLSICVHSFIIFLIIPRGYIIQPFLIIQEPIYGFF
jgi:hypothetical protein